MSASSLRRPSPGRGHDDEEFCECEKQQEEEEEGEDWQAGRGDIRHTEVEIRDLDRDHLLLGLTARGLKTYLDTVVISEDFLVPPCIRGALTPQNKADAEALVRTLNEAGGAYADPFKTPARRIMADGSIDWSKSCYVGMDLVKVVRSLLNGYDFLQVRCRRMRVCTSSSNTQPASQPARISIDVHSLPPHHPSNTRVYPNRRCSGIRLVSKRSRTARCSSSRATQTSALRLCSSHGHSQPASRTCPGCLTGN